MAVDNDYINAMMQRLLEQSEETQKTVVSLDKKVDLHIQKTELQLAQINKLDEQQNEILEAHHARSDGLKRDNELREQALRMEIEKIHDRLELKIDSKASKDEISSIKEKLEEVQKPHETLQSFIKVVVYLGTAAGAVYGIYQLITIFFTH